MDQQAFETKLRADGYTEIETRSYAPRPANGDHGHHFSVRGLILEGAFIVSRDGKAVTYRAGDVFEVPEGALHHEEVGPEGTRILIGRKY